MVGEAEFRAISVIHRCWGCVHMHAETLKDTFNIALFIKFSINLFFLIWRRGDQSSGLIKEQFSARQIMVFYFYLIVFKVSVRALSKDSIEMV